MTDLNLEKVIAEIRSLSPDDQEHLRRLLNGSVVSMEKDELPIKPRIVGTYTPKDRSKENAWLVAHQAEYAGQWLALYEDRLISHGWKLKEVSEAAKQAGIPDALFVRAEASNLPAEIGANLEAR